MISYKQSRNILKKSKIMIGSEILKSDNCLNRVSASNIFCKFNNPTVNNSAFDGYAINSIETKNLSKALSEAHRVLKPGGRYLCLEFSKIQNSSLNVVYKNYSKLIPLIGKLVVGEREPYEYLVKSIENFINQEELLNLMKKNGFEKCTYRNLSGGIVSIHSGWKI